MQAKKDNNNVDTMLGLSSADGSTPSIVKADPTNHGMSVDDNTTGSDLSTTDDAKRDENSVPTILAVSESDGLTPVQLYVNADGKLLIDSN